ncbi:MAG: hypothetical protein V3W18_07505 [candidate division Zixibacteria bacterium]
MTKRFNWTVIAIFILILANNISNSQVTSDSLRATDNLRDVSISTYDSLLKSHDSILSAYKDLLAKKQAPIKIEVVSTEPDSITKLVFSITTIIIAFLGLALAYRKYKDDKIRKNYLYAILAIFLIISILIIAVNLATGIISLIFGLIQTLAIIFASLVALIGIGEWRKEIRGLSEFNVAFELLSSIYRFRDVISYIRSPFYVAGEGRTRQGSEGESETESKVYDRAYVVFERYYEKNEVFSNLEVLRYKSEALFESNDLSIFKDIMKVKNDILFAANNLITPWLDVQKKYKLGIEIGKIRQDELDTNQAIIYEKYRAKDDKIKEEVDKIVSRVEKICLPIIRGK